MSQAARAILVAKKPAHHLAGDPANGPQKKEKKPALMRIRTTLDHRGGRGSVRGRSVLSGIGRIQHDEAGADDRIRKRAYILDAWWLVTFPGLCDFPDRVFRQSDRGRAERCLQTRKLRER